MCTRVPRSAGHCVDDPQLGVGKDDSAGSDRREGEHLPAVVADDSGELEQEFRPAHYRPKHSVGYSH